MTGTTHGSVISRRWFGAAVVATVTLAVRIPILFSAGAITYDEGVYGESVLAMRHGAKPFLDIFSSQGPVFLPLLRVGDLLGFEAHWAPRLVTVGAAVAIATAVWFISHNHFDPATAIGVGVVAGTSGSILFAAGPLQSDGPALALAAWAVALATVDTRRPTAWLVVAVGLLTGAAVATKSLFVAPAAAAIAVLYVLRNKPRRLAVAGAVGIATTVLAAIPWDPMLVVDQSIRFHFAVVRSSSMADNLGDLIAELGRREKPLLIFLLALALLSIHRRRRPDGALARALGTWLLGSLLILVLVDGPNPGYNRYLAIAVVPALMLIGILGLRPAVAISLAILTIPVQLVTQPVIRTNDMTSTEAAAVEVIEGIPEDAMVVTDEPGLAWQANRPTPPELVDPSHARIGAGYLTVADVVSAMSDPSVCVYAPLGNRFSTLESIDPVVLGFTDVIELGEGQMLYLRTGCRG